MTSIFISLSLILTLWTTVAEIWSRFPLDLEEPCIYCKLTINVFPNGNWLTKAAKVELTEEDCMRPEDVSVFFCEQFEMDNCSLYSPWGTRLASCADLVHQPDVFIVPEKRLFILPYRGRGASMEMVHINVLNDEPIFVEAISKSPRIFRVLNLFNSNEAELMIEAAQEKFFQNQFIVEEEEGESSSYGTSWDPRRHADRVDISDSAISKTIRRRIFDFLGIFPFEESFSEGLEVLRYRGNGTVRSMGFHRDFVEDNHGSNQLNFNSAYDGINRFVAVYLTLRQPASGTGGELCFPLLDPLPPDTLHDNMSTSLITSEEPEYDTQDEQNAILEQINAQILQLGCLRNDSRDDDGDLSFSPYHLLLGDEDDDEDEYSNEDDDNEVKHSPLITVPRERKRSAFSTIDTDDEEEDVDDNKDSAEQEFRVFPDGSPDDSDLAAKCQELQEQTYFAKLRRQQLREEQQVRKQCNNRLVIPAKVLEATVVYAQHVDGLPDMDALHGVLPVLHPDDEKLTAAMWIWNGPRESYWQRNEITGRLEKPILQAVSASFECIDVPMAYLMFEGQLWEILQPGRTVKVNTFAGHSWHVIVNDEVVASWVIASEKPRQKFVLTASDLPVEIYG